MASDQMTEFGAGEASRLGGPARCTQCRLGEYEFDWARSYGVYAGSLRAAILQLKFHRRQRLGRRLGTALAAAWAEEVLDREIAESEAAVLVPVPLHPSRQRGRGFNQAEELGRGLARALIHKSGQAPRLEIRCLRRVGATPPQSGLALRARHENVRGVFEVRSAEPLRDRLVVLVDDVMTTGATASACAKALKRAGARQVAVLTLARATPQFPDIGIPSSHLPVDDSPRERQ